MKRTNREIDPDLMKKAKKRTRLNSQKEVVNLALENLVKGMDHKKMATLRGKVQWEGDLDEMRSG